MKKSLFVFLVVLFCFAAKAQKHRIDIGVETGLSLMGTQIVPKYDNFSVTMFEYNGGLTLLCSLTENLAVRTGFFYMADFGTYMAGQERTETKPMMVVVAFYRSRSLNIPLAFRGSLGRRFRVFGEIGVVPGCEYLSTINRLGDFQSDNLSNVDEYGNPTSVVYLSSRSPFFRALLDLRAGCNFQLSSRLMLEAGIGMYMTTRPLDLSTYPDFISGKMEFPAHLSLYYKI